MFAIWDIFSSKFWKEIRLNAEQWREEAVRDRVNADGILGELWSVGLTFIAQCVEILMISKNKSKE